MDRCTLGRKKGRKISFQALEVKESTNTDKREICHIWGDTKCFLWLGTGHSGKAWR